MHGFLRLGARHGGLGGLAHRQFDGLSLPGVVAFGRDGAGELYMIAQSRVWKIVQ